MLDGRGIGVRFLIGAEIIVAPVVFGETLRPTQPPVEWVMGAVCPGSERLVLEAVICFPSSAEINMCGVVTPLPSYMF